MKKLAQPAAQPKETMDRSMKAMDGPGSFGLQTLFLYLAKLVDVLPSLTAPPQAYPSIIDPTSGAVVDAGGLVVQVSSNRFDLPHVVTLRNPDTLAAIGGSTPVTFTGGNLGDSSVTIPPAALLDPPTNFLIEVEPTPGNKSSIIVTRRGMTIPEELEVTISTNPAPPFTVGVAVEFTASVTGGATPYSYFGKFKAPLAFKDTNPASHTFNVAGTYEIELIVNDSTVPSPLAKIVKYGPFDVV